MGALEAGTLYVTLGVDITQLTEGLATGAARFSAFAQGAQQAIAQATQGMQAAAQSLAGAATSGEAATGRIAAGAGTAKSAYERLTAQLDAMEAGLHAVAGTEIAPKLNDAGLRTALGEIQALRTDVTELS